MPLRPLNPDLSAAHRLGAQLRGLRVDAGHTQKSLSEKVHVSESLIAAIEKGERISTVEVIESCDVKLGAQGTLVTLWHAAAASRRGVGRPPGRTVRLGSEVDLSFASSLDRALDHVERVLMVRLDRAVLEHRGASVDVRTDRGTRVRIERCAVHQVADRGWGGPEAALALDGVAVPAWFNAVTWRDEGSQAVWRADEMALVQCPPVETDPVLRTDPRLPEAWWRTWNASLDALAGNRFARIAVADDEPITEDHVTRVIQKAWPTPANVHVCEWSSAHSAMSWGKVTGPVCFIIDWTNWGRAPRGLDAATLWSCSLAVPALADRIWDERRAELESPTGIVMAFYSLARVLTDPDTADGPLAEPARHAAARLSWPAGLAVA
jgi:transcriptional regulator with XRE-family HTH domain